MQSRYRMNDYVLTSNVVRELLIDLLYRSFSDDVTLFKGWYADLSDSFDRKGSLCAVKDHYVP
jgi:hypothetical protein